MAPSPPRGILKKGSSSIGARAATWDELNLRENEHVKAALNTTKIDEPKTPYHAPLEGDDALPAFDLDHDGDVQKSDAGQDASESASPGPSDVEERSKVGRKDGRRRRSTLSNAALRPHRTSSRRTAFAGGKQVLEAEEAGDQDAKLPVKAAAVAAAEQNDGAETAKVGNSGGPGAACEPKAT